MLVITRRRGERFRIGTDVEIVVTSVADGKVRLGISAPRDTQIIRDNARQKVPVRR
jgi:carbon storage regulator